MTMSLHCKVVKTRKNLNRSGSFGKTGSMKGDVLGGPSGGKKGSSPTDNIAENNSKTNSQERSNNFEDLRKILPFLTVASGLRPEVDEEDIDKYPKRVNIHAWKLNDLYSLRSEIIRLMLLIEHNEKHIHTTYDKGIKTIIQKSEEKEALKPLRLVQIEKTEPPTRALTPMTSASAIPSNPSRGQRRSVSSAQRSLRNSDDSKGDSSSINADTIWDYTAKFFKPVHSVAIFDRLFVPLKDSFDGNKLKEPLGKHYSLISQKSAKSLNQPLLSRIIMPPPPFKPSSSVLSTPYLHRLLIGAIIDTDSSKSIIPEPQDTPSEGKMLETRKSIIKGERLSTPVVPYLGYSRYGLETFDNRLQMELESVGIMFDSDGFKPTVYPLSMEMNELAADEPRQSAFANNAKKTMAQYLQTKREVFTEIIMRQKRWDTALNIYLQHEETSKSTAKKKKKPRSDTAADEDSN